MHNHYRAQLTDVDVDDSFVDDVEASEDYKREYARYLLGRDLNETLFWGREQLAALSLK